MSHLDGAGIAVAGAGRDLHAARKPATIEVAGTTVGLVAVTDHPSEFAAGEQEPGVAHADLGAGLPDWLLAEVARAREECDWLIAFPHWGPNMTTEPARWQRKAAAALQEAGADLVAGHSAHVFHGVGWEARGPVVFDLGDALDDYRVDSGLRNDLGLMAIWRPGDPERELELVGLELEFCFTRVAEGPAADWIARRLDRACGELGTTRGAPVGWWVPHKEGGLMVRAPGRGRCRHAYADGHDPVRQQPEGLDPGRQVLLGGVLLLRVADPGDRGTEDHRGGQHARNLRRVVKGAAGQDAIGAGGVGAGEPRCFH